MTHPVSSTVRSPATAPAPGIRLLRRSLLGNALFSTACGAALIGASAWLAPRLGPPAWALIVVGALLLPFAWEVARAARRASLRRGEIRTILWLDVGWVLLSAALLLAGWLPLTVAGVWAVIGIAEVVAAFALLQAVGLRRSAALRGAR